MIHPWRTIAEHLAAKKHERELLAKLVERLLAELRQNDWHEYRLTRSRRTADIMAERVLSRRGIGRTDDDDPAA
jgi:hypothetical protein